MKDAMTIGDIRILKQALEKKIRDQITEFHEQTGVFITGVDTIVSNAMGGIAALGLKVEL